MKALLSLLLLCCITCGAAGCAMCCTPYDDDYSAHGGRWQRTDMRHGRVGSAFAPAGAMAGGEFVDEQFVGDQFIDGEVIVE